MERLKKIIAMASIFVVAFCCTTTCFADYSETDYVSIGYKQVYDYNMETSLYMEVYQQSTVDSATGQRTDCFKTIDGERIERFFTIEDDFNGDNLNDELKEWFRYVPTEIYELKTIDGLTIKPALSGEITNIELRNGSWIDMDSDTLINEDLLYPYYTEDGLGVIGYREYGICGDISVIYVLASQEQPLYKVTLYPDTLLETKTTWSDVTEYIVFSGVSGEYITLPKCPYSKEGYKFVCWDDEYNQYKAGDKYRIPNRDCTLRAVWEKDTSEEPVRPSTPSRPITPAKPTYTCPYTDISDHWAKDIIKYIDNLNLVDGETETTFAPDKPMTRETFVTAMARLADVESNYVDWAINIGLLKGYGNGEYGLNDTITREQMAVFFLRFLELTDVDYEDCKTIAHYNFADDEQIADWAKEAVYEMQALDLIHGKGNDVFDPKGLTTRAEGATVLYNLCETVLNK